MKLDAKVSIFHAIFGAAFGYLTNYVYTFGLGMFSGVASFVFMLITLVITGNLASMIFGRESMNQKEWMGSGVVPFFFIWLVFWIMTYNGVFY
ncbi:DUF5379 domain-containing protein [Methanococcus maripaludis]|uniref:Uncharacterized protein n=1 Tax=Methanococcus maripaludis TaxID=39152 RepID=A0A2L1CA48_METMI|nr:DUF5379 domain-containing protein [Methanococcus maripaludis]AVB76248.1 hypothetical protein MMJJ_08380 [Methanococcus maripaludis]MBA2853259.1 hypothetical protein [Methanococcus maripaludis]MBA2860323.1 hypothetical protein [Methanococcus maripaludis]MBA2864671.1 hypothetical protein [Methanococcus maripaludis]MBA2869213.1 hypothetical protein [Methanococcus maripaludis]